MPHLLHPPFDFSQIFLLMKKSIIRDMMMSTVVCETAATLSMAIRFSSQVSRDFTFVTKKMMMELMDTRVIEINRILKNCLSRFFFFMTNPRLMIHREMIKKIKAII